MMNTNATVAGTAASDPALGPPTAAQFLGGMFIEIFLVCVLYGVTSLQTFIYYQSFPNDKRSLKLLVGAVWIMETAHTTFCMSFMYYYLITGFGHPEWFPNVHWGTAAAIFSSAVISMCVQGFYTWRVWIVSDKAVVWTSIIAVFALLRFAFGLGSAALTFTYHDWIFLRGYTPALVTVSGGLGSGTFVDLLVALTLMYYLRRNSSNVHEHSQSMVNKVLIYSVNTGAITGTATLTCVILYAAIPDSLVFLGLVALETKLYANSFLGSLNARAFIRGAEPASGWKFTSAIPVSDFYAASTATHETMAGVLSRPHATIRDGEVPDIKFDAV